MEDGRQSGYTVLGDYPSSMVAMFNSSELSGWPASKWRWRFLLLIRSAFQQLLPNHRQVFRRINRQPDLITPNPQDSHADALSGG